MGVKGLWKLLDSTGKPIPVEKLQNKVLSIDVSIWMYQIIKGVRESELSATTNKHLIVMFHRICKLLFFGIKPIFVFDGGVPELKKKTIAHRQAQKSQAKNFSGKNKEKILKNMLEQAALKTVMNPGSTPTEDEVISQTVNSLNKETAIDMFQLPKLPESFELDKTIVPTKEKGRSYNKTTEQTLLLAVENQENDILHTNSTEEKAKSSPAKLNAFSSLQIGELLNGFSDDQKRLAERKKQQKSKREMTLNELEMFLNDNNEENATIIDEFSQKIDSDHDTVFYYESGINDTAKSSSSKSNIVPENKKIYDLGKNIKSELKNNSTKSFATDVVGPPALTNDIDEDMFKALADSESLEEDRLAWLIFNENKKASKRRSSEHESPSIKCSKLNTSINCSNYSEVDEDFHTKFDKTALSMKLPSKSIFVPENDLCNEFKSSNCKDEDLPSLVSVSQDELSLPKLEKRESSIDFLNVPSTSKSLSMISEDDISNKPKKDLKNINSPLLFLPKSNKSGENDLFSCVSSSRKSDLSDEAFSENSLDFSTEKSSSHDNSDSSTTDEHQELEDAAITESSKTNLNSPTISQNESEFNTLLDENFGSRKKFDPNSIISSKPLDDQTSPIDEQYLQSIQDTLFKHQNDLASLQRTYDQMASSITQKMTSDIKNLLRLFGIPYITAPMEAEAQCAFLEKVGCTEGTVTDDSDIWLFGASIVYKDFFDSHKFVKQFKSIDIQQKFALSRDNFVQLAFLVGSDYTNGIDGIGPVSAIEILSFFESKTKNMNIEDKLLKIKEIANSKSEMYSDIPFMKKLRSSKIGSDFPNKAVINAYLNPIVNKSNEKFKWDTPQEDLIIQFAQKHFDWDISKTKCTLAPVLKKVSERTKQKSLDSYVKTLPKLSNTNTGMSKRVSLAVKRLRNEVITIETNNQLSKIPKKSTKEKKISKK